MYRGISFVLLCRSVEVAAFFVLQDDLVSIHWKAFPSDDDRVLQVVGWEEGDMSLMSSVLSLLYVDVMVM